MTQEICYNCEGRGHGDGDMWLFVCPRCGGSCVLESAQQNMHLTSGSLRGLWASFWIRVSSALKHFTSPPAGR
jgi:hypothetical protein